MKMTMMLYKKYGKRLGNWLQARGRSNPGVTLGIKLINIIQGETMG
jgi:hypothetical protein